tara:strand:+ start:140 stop:589 length:450 start_codon:yes stop_codon:yes gene_type:complete
MAQNRLQREMESRTTQERPKQWQQAELLPEPDKEPGYVYRWVRTATLNTADPRNLSGKLREGWEPVQVEEQPKFKLLIDPSSRFSSNIEIGGLLLCKCPSELMDQRDEYFARQARSQEEAVDNNLMRQSDPRMPLFNERRSSTSFGKGS